MQLKGTITALITPFTKQKVDEQRLVHHIHDQLDQGVNGILLLGITGESCTLTPEEQERMIQLGKNEIAGKVPLIVGTDSNSTQKAIEKAQKAKELGANAILVVTPYFNKPTQEGIFRHFQAITQAVNIPLIVYNHPGRSIVAIEPATLLKIVELPNIIAIKDAAENLSQAGDFIYALKDKKPKIAIFSADDISTYTLMSLGADGVISAISNLIPAKMVALVNALLQKNFEKALEMHFELFPLLKAAFIETNPIPIKTAMNLCGMQMGEFRLPMCEMQAENLERLKQVLAAMQFIKN